MRCQAEAARSTLRILLKAVAVAGLAIAFAGIGWFVWTGESDALRLPNNLLAVSSLLMLVTVASVPRLARRHLVLSDHVVLSVGSIVFALEALYANLARPLHLYVPVFGHLGFASLLLSFGFAALQVVAASEQRLLAIDSELDVARRLQFSILPTVVPEVAGIRIAAAYHPMTAVAGDFYDFLPVDRARIGVLIADVSGHGVPAALIASMIKIAIQSVVPWAREPREVLRRLNALLSGQLREQFVSAAYLWLDTERSTASYSSAGHPPLLLWRDGELQRIESNGVVFGFQQNADYPVRAIPLLPGDRLLLYTDGVIEAENAAEEFFGDRRLEEVIRDSRSLSAAALSDELLAQIRRWRRSILPQDDITLVVIDVQPD